MDHRGEVPAGFQVHMFDGINPIPIDVRKGNPEFEYPGQRLEGIRRLILIHVARSPETFNVSQLARQSGQTPSAKLLPRCLPMRFIRIARIG